ncbi:hypothetical protein QNH20_10675 [Neobacillus sp. WH10]|uniref:hypothetical protein n=1 Tax=Neobacillus sp. WH10 TaxID=3047873 RepID=UPI0024C12BDF|nr:hypothetical protein [Neobacillus sp. WH10]WHY79564.1 hypothetical protein QNH20_10675 [Neobacillus sp. WH10]
MIKITFDNLSVMKMSNTSGIFIGKKNTHKNFRKESVINEVVGALSGNENRVRKNNWTKNRERWEEN